MALLGTLLLVFAFRAAIAVKTGFWCDELAWLTHAQGGFAATLRSIANDPSPHGPLDVAALWLVSKPLLALGLPPQLAVRFHALAFATATSALPFLSRKISKLERWSWLGWSCLNVAITQMAFNARPYAGMIFFSSCGLFAALELGRLERKPGSRQALFFYVALLALGPLEQVYLEIVGGVVALLLVFADLRRAPKLSLLSVLGVGLGAGVWWQLVCRVHPASAFAQQAGLAHAPAASARCFEYAREVFGVFSNPGRRVFLMAPLAAWGAWLAAKSETRRLTLALWGTPALCILVPYALDAKYGYFFAPRQTFAALPFWGWFVAAAVGKLARLPRLGAAAVAAAALFAGALPLWHLVHDDPPFIDQPRHLPQQFVTERLKTGSTVLVLSACEAGEISLYATPEGFTRYFENYGQNAPFDYEALARPRVRTWSKNSLSCFGQIPETPDDPELLRAIENERSRFVVFAPFQATIPRALKGLPCYNEMNRPCD